MYFILIVWHIILVILVLGLHVENHVFNFDCSLNSILNVVHSPIFVDLTTSKPSLLFIYPLFPVLVELRSNCSCFLHARERARTAVSVTALQWLTSRDLKHVVTMISVDMVQGDMLTKGQRCSCFIMLTLDLRHGAYLLIFCSVRSVTLGQELRVKLWSVHSVEAQWPQWHQSPVKKLNKGFTFRRWSNRVIF